MNYWKPDEIARFIEALKLYGRDWVNIEKHMGNRGRASCKTLGIRFLQKEEKHPGSQDPEVIKILKTINTEPPWTQEEND